MPHLSCCIAQKAGTSIRQRGFSQTSSSTSAAQIKKVCAVIWFWIATFWSVEHYCLGIIINDANRTNFNNNKWRGLFYFLRHCLRDAYVSPVSSPALTFSEIVHLRWC